MTDRRQVLLALVSAFGLSLAGGYGYAAFSNEEKVEVTIDASNLDDSGEPEVDASSRNDSDGHAFGASAFGGGPASDASATPLRCTHHVDSDRDIDSDPDSNRGTDSDDNHDPDTIRWRKHQFRLELTARWSSQSTEHRSKPSFPGWLPERTSAACGATSLPAALLRGAVRGRHQHDTPPVRVG